MAEDQPTAESQPADTGPMKKMFCISNTDEERIQAIQERFNLNRSDIVRRGLEMLYEYLIMDRLPDGQSRSEVEGPKDTVAEETASEAVQEA